MAKDILDAVYGCMIGGAIGDAMGAPVAGWNYWEIRETYGRLDRLMASPLRNTNQLPGGVTAGTALRQYVALAIVRKVGRITPDDLACLWTDRGNSELFGSNERAVYDKLASGMNPWASGRGASATGTATMSIAPVGIINATDPAQAYQDGYAIASVNQDGEEQDAAASLAAGLSAAVVPGTHFDDVLDTMKRHGSFLMKRAIDLTMDLAASSRSIEEFIGSFYAQMADWRMAGPVHQIRPVPEGYPARAKFCSSSSLESIPVALALSVLSGGDINEGIIEGVNFGRASNTIACIVGGLLGALQGATLIRGSWIELCETANRDLFEALEEDPSQGFYSMAWRLVSALGAERKATAAKLKDLDKLLGR
jgi:ADP-ribosylglycohydrolase